MGRGSAEIGLLRWNILEYLWVPSCAGAIVVLCFSGFWTAVGANEARTREELYNLRDKIDTLQQQLDTEREKGSWVASDLLGIEKQLVSLNLERRNSMSELEDLKVEKMQTRLDMFNMQVQEKQMRKNLSKVVRSGFMLDQRDSISLVLNGEDPARSLQLLAMHRYIVDARKNQVDEIRQFQIRYAMVAENLESREAEISQVVATLEENRLSLMEMESNRQSQLDAIRVSLSNNENRVTEYKSQEKELQRLLNQLARERIERAREQASREKIVSNSEQQTSRSGATRVADKNNAGSQAAIFTGGFDKNRGNLNMPVKGKILKKFGQIRPESGLKWDGMMLGVQDGQQVNAIYDGQVIFSDWFGSYGQLLVLDHGDGYMSLYGHNQLLEVELGSTVRAGDRIALAGNTGGLVTSGLYFEIRHNGVPANPLKWCRLEL
jgi:septal ring factor EnvC (AmiA/AmiB activator)